jgi:hypothetical protein
VISGVLTPALGGGFKQAAGGLITDVVLETHVSFSTTLFVR